MPKLPAEAYAIIEGRHSDPFHYLGLHAEGGKSVVRAFLPEATNVEAVGEAYAIASNYLRKTGAIADTLATNDRLLGIIVQLFQRGEYNKIRLANKAIAKFEAETLIIA